ncbi:MAG: radical SAM protein [Bacteroidales bacterium]|jgi:radical SAM superfamily enzyme YgiQ (UPF0313 family)
MKITFVHRSHESLGLSYLSAKLKADNHQVDLVFDPSLFNDDVLHWRDNKKKYKKLAIRAINKNPDLIGFSIVTSDYKWAVNIATEIKNRSNCPIIFGGIHATASSEEVIECDPVDIVAIGEAENSISNLTRKWDEYKARGFLEIEGLWFKMKNNKIIKNPWPSLPDLNSIPFPDMDLFSNTSCTYHRYVIAASRGCNRFCSYCYNSYLHKMYRKDFKRRRTTESVISELEIAKQKRKIKTVWFLDDNFVEDEQWTIEFCKKYKERIHIPFFCIIHANELTFKSAEALAKARCRTVQIGVQTINPKLGRRVLHREINLDRIRQACEYLHNVKINIIVDHIIGIPGEVKEDYYYALDFYNELQPKLIGVFQLTLYPGTDLLKMDCIKNSEFYHEMSKGTIHMLSRPNINALQRNFVFIMNILPLLPKGLINRLIKFYKKTNSPIPFATYISLIFRIINAFRWRDPITTYHFFRYIRGFFFMKS